MENWNILKDWSILAKQTKQVKEEENDEDEDMKEEVKEEPEEEEEGEAGSAEEQQEVEDEYGEEVKQEQMEDDFEEEEDEYPVSETKVGIGQKLENMPVLNPCLIVKMLMINWSILGIELLGLVADCERKIARFPILHMISKLASNL